MAELDGTAYGLRLLYVYVIVVVVAVAVGRVYFSLLCDLSDRVLHKSQRKP